VSSRGTSSRTPGPSARRRSAAHGSRPSRPRRRPSRGALELRRQLERIGRRSRRLEHEPDLERLRRADAEIDGLVLAREEVDAEPRLRDVEGLGPLLGEPAPDGRDRQALARDARPAVARRVAGLARRAGRPEVELLDGVRRVEADLPRRAADAEEPVARSPAVTGSRNDRMRVYGRFAGS
jgi:hypothetical protein